ncbi:beta-galactosidase [Catalinimonas alkaloidigena]|uniref:Beta-galactosidase n=2 Tax=Catalinimonas alkaloidigena TaxID=1075417 RepID=A0A1G9HS32_9BACT|nr:beta-galactosidase [Catalinimonas alkaloidigena]
MSHSSLAQPAATRNQPPPRERISINADWRFYKYDAGETADGLIYDLRPEVQNFRDDRPADAMPTEAVDLEAADHVLKRWILPTGNEFIKDPSRRFVRPEGSPGGDFAFTQADFDDSAWQQLNLPHDWAVAGPFYEGERAEVGGSMGRLPSHGVAWYRKKLSIPAGDAGKRIFLDLDGAMAYTMVWLNGQLVGGWPYGYNAFRLDLTPYVKPGAQNQLAIRLDNPPNSARWYPGGGIYRNVWLTKTNPIHVGHWGVRVQTSTVSPKEATVELTVTVDNDATKQSDVLLQVALYELDANGNKGKKPVATFRPVNATLKRGESTDLKTSVKLSNPKLWGPPPTQTPHRYAVEVTLVGQKEVVDRYEEKFGIRTIETNADKGLFVNGEHIYIKGVNQHHDLGALGAAFNVRAAERQLEMLRELGCNAIRMAHNPPAPELLAMTDSLGFLVVDEVFDVWARKKPPLDFHLIFPDWHEQDLRAMIRRDKNHPSVIMWSFGNEVGEQYTGDEGAQVGQRLHDIAKDEDPSRPAMASMNYAKPDMPFPETMDVLSLNYQGEGIRNAPAYAGLRGINTPPLYPAFHEKFPNKMIISSENAASLSSRGTYLFPVEAGYSAPVKDSSGGDPKTRYVSAYELYTADFGSSADKVFATLDQHPYVAGGFVWSGWDYLGEPTPYYLSRSSYFGIIDLAGFKKDRFYLYQSRWRPELPMAHILPHWNWPDRQGKVTPVHVFTSGDEAELFLNGKSLGKKKKGKFDYRLRWDEVTYTPGTLTVTAYKQGKVWAADTVRTTGPPASLVALVDRNQILPDGNDLAFVTIQVQDAQGLAVPTANNELSFSIRGPGEIIATDNGDPTDMVAFPSLQRQTFNGLALAIVRFKPGAKGDITVVADSPGLQSARAVIKSLETSK